ncbi:Putative calcium/proton exchanger, sodium/calcium exchanger membrane region [Septoria linicola]|uniref:Calcium/proton exchanger, sodium/calcium exchanger membrane region n=1 Tax=Septoria linicola TaxID=215465 RepID=A0A9Q9B1D5_9PEZI|nr:Putative calcium/proton exchanger, sodium/calcium exchanger membrane region [Septoria linicola]
MGNPLLTLIQDRYRVQALRTASERNLSRIDSNGSVVPVVSNANSAKGTKNNEAGGLSNTAVGGGASSRPPTRNDATREQQQPRVDGSSDHGGAVGGYGSHAEKAAHNHQANSITQNTSPTAPPPVKSEAAGTGDSTITDTQDGKKKKNPMTIARMKAGSKRFGVHFKNAICHSWINVLLVAVPAGIAAEAAGLQPAVVFAINAVAIVPLAGMLAHATESVASRLGDTLGALLNVSFGNAVELIIFIIALVKNEIRIVQASLLGSILANLLLILGMAFLFGGLRFREQVYNSTVTQMSACLLSLSVMSLLLPTAFHASFRDEAKADADLNVLKVSRGTSVILLFVYILYLLFQLKSHAYMYESTPQHIVDEESHPGVLHDLMNSSSSSDSSSSSSSSSSDSDESGSVATTSKRVKRMFKHKKRRKSSASTSTTATNSILPSVISSPSTEKPTTDYFRDPTFPASRRGSILAAIASGDEGDNEDGRTRTFDWAGRHHSNETSKSPEPVKRRHSKKSKKKEKEKKRRQKQEDAANQATIEANGASPAPETESSPKVAFSDNVQTNEIQATPSKRPFNMRAPTFRPALSSYLSNTVFSSQAQNAAGGVTPRPNGSLRSISNGNGGLRRTNSLPDRLNRSITPAQSSNPHGPLPPYQHTATAGYRVNSGLASTEGEEEDEGAIMSRTAAVVLLLCSTALVAVCAEFMVDAIPLMIADSPVSEAFIGLIILPIVGNAAEHVTAVTVAAKNKMDLAIGIAVGSSIQIALFVTPIVVLLGWILDTNMSLYFNIFETISLFVTVFVVNFLVLDGRSNYLEGSLLIAAYVIIALAAFFYPSTASQSNLGGGSE